MARPNRGGLKGPHIIGTLVPMKEPSTASIADIGTLGHFTFSTGGIAQVPSIAALRGEYSRAWRENG